MSHLAKTLEKFIHKEKISIIAEIGVLKSDTCKYLLSTLGGAISEYWAVDAWISVSRPYTERKISHERWERQYLHACKLMVSFPQLHVIRTKSLKAAKLFPEEYFDLVFIDADHSYQAVTADIVAWLPKVRKNGILAGHDYHEKHPGVIQAVNDYFGKTFERLHSAVWARRME